MSGTRLCFSLNSTLDKAHAVSMEQNRHLCSSRDSSMDTAEDRTGLKMEGIEIEDTDSCTALSDETHQHLSIGDEPSSSCTEVRAKFRPRLLATKSFPPYSQCIGGLGEDTDWDNDLDSELQMACQSNAKEDMPHVKPNEVDDPAKYSREVLRARWRSRRKERQGGSFDVGTDGCDRGRWSGKRRVDESEITGEHDDEERDEGKHWRGRSSSLERGENNEGKQDGKPSSTSAAQEGNCSSMEAPEESNEEAEDMPSHRHPILSKLLHSSTSSCSSINLSSESDEVFSDIEDAMSKRKTFKKSRTWKTFLTMMHWSLRRQSSWVQLAGHQGNFQVSKGGEVLKLYSELEAKCLDCLMRDALRPFVPQYHGLVTRGEHCYIRLEDLLNGLRRPVIMDCKMGVRTFQEEELIKARTKPNMRSDMYQKMIKVDPSAPTAEEHAQKGVTKWRYLQWRDTTSSTSTLGFRIEGIMMEDGTVQRDFRKIQTLSQVTEALLYFTRNQLETLNAYHSRLLDLKDALRSSQFFRNHEVIGSSLLFVHDHNKASVWMIDFGKTMPLPDLKELQHSVPWVEGNREDGYLIGLTSILTALSQAISVAEGQQGGS
ncbi:PREDICTED: inositol-trisphosphate 3-kinase A-like [Cyprinodon variegatus]|uniref:inositol-trisphosphate 3-kinase A-like n=1 Tax=Cyprinodon variegatus TaxID=28743 RepID=UPI0007427280|nr:PREDICTED: inositol-trisphosphate 3-kinase A-like [Cyprinodon variegatus]